MCTTRTINIQTFVQCAAVLITPFTPALPLTVTRIGRFNTIKTGGGGRADENGRNWNNMKAIQRKAEWLPVNDVETRVVQR
jgi:hypothetical protein